jgi:hypothetical protein
MVIQRAPRFLFATDAGSSAAGSWTRAREVREARAYVVAGPGPMSVRPGGIRASRTVRRDRPRLGTTPARGWRR